MFYKPAALCRLSFPNQGVLKQFLDRELDVGVGGGFVRLFIYKRAPKTTPTQTAPPAAAAAMIVISRPETSAKIDVSEIT